MGDTTAVVAAGDWSASLLAAVEAALETPVARLGPDRVACDPGLFPGLIGSHEHPWLLIGRGMSEDDAMAVVGAAYAAAPALLLAVLGPANDTTRASRWLRLGCDVYLADVVTPSRLVATMELATSGHVVVVDRRCGASETRERDALRELTARENEILDLVSTGLSNAEIARKLYLSRRTVEFHLTRIFAKLGVTGRVEAVTYVYRTMF